MNPSQHRKIPWSSCAAPLIVLLLSPLFSTAQIELKRVDRAVYAGVGYEKLGFGEVNRELLTKKQARKISQRLEQILTDHGAVVILASLVPEEVNDWNRGGLRGLPKDFMGEDPRVQKNNITILFSETDGQNWISYGCENKAWFQPHTQALSEQFASTYRKGNSNRAIRRLLKKADRIYSRIPAAEKAALLNPRLSADQWLSLASAEMDLLHDYDLAIEHLGHALALDSANAATFTLLGHARLEQQQWSAAAMALERSWSLAAGFDACLGILTLHHLQDHKNGVKEWAGRLRQCSPEFEKKIYEAAHYPAGGLYVSETARSAFVELFQEEINESKKIIETSPGVE